MTKSELWYIAGFFDGEGSINILTRKRPVHTEYTLTVAIGQKDGETLDWIKDNFGGNVYLVKRDGSFFWAISHKKAISFLKKIYPMLRYKKPQAKVAIEFYEKMPRRERITSPEEMKRREKARQDLMDLKKNYMEIKVRRYRD